MKYSSGKSRLRKPAADPAAEGAGKAWERVLLFCGILAVAMTLAVPMAQGQAEGKRAVFDSRDVVAVMSGAVRDPENREEAREASGAGGEEPVSAGEGESVYDGIGRFFARLLTGG